MKHICQCKHLSHKAADAITQEPLFMHKMLSDEEKTFMKWSGASGELCICIPCVEAGHLDEFFKVDLDKRQPEIYHIEPAPAPWDKIEADDEDPGDGLCEVSRREMEEEDKRLLEKYIHEVGELPAVFKKWPEGGCIQPSTKPKVEDPPVPTWRNYHLRHKYSPKVADWLMSLPPGTAIRLQSYTYVRVHDYGSMTPSMLRFQHGLDHIDHYFFCVETGELVHASYLALDDEITLLKHDWTTKGTK